jgi:hypothetical protein
LSELFIKEKISYKIIDWEVAPITDDIEVESMNKA